MSLIEENLGNTHSPSETSPILKCFLREERDKISRSLQQNARDTLVGFCLIVWPEEQSKGTKLES
jgi:hypothetical protein